MWFILGILGLIGINIVFLGLKALHQAYLDSMKCKIIPSNQQTNAIDWKGAFLNLLLPNSSQLHEGEDITGTYRSGSSGFGLYCGETRIDIQEDD